MALLTPTPLQVRAELEQAKGKEVARMKIEVGRELTPFTLHLASICPPFTYSPPIIPLGRELGFAG